MILYYQMLIFYYFVHKETSSSLFSLAPKNFFFTLFFGAKKPYSPSFSLAQRKEAKETSTSSKPPPIWGGLTAFPSSLAYP